MNDIESEGNKTENKDMMLKVYSEAVNVYHYHYNFIIYTSYVALFVASVAISFVLGINVEDIGFNPILFYGIFFGLTLMLCFGYCYLIRGEDDDRINARKIAGRIEDILDVPDELKLITKEEKNRGKIVSLSKLSPSFFFICWFSMLLLVISKYMGIVIK